MAEAAAPIAYLKALTEESAAALRGQTLALTTWPFRVGRESRIPVVARLAGSTERRASRGAPNNDLYIIDRHASTFVSREHFEICWTGTGFELVDRGSVVGTVVEGRFIGGNRQGGRLALDDHDVIIVGSHQGGFIFKFRTEAP